MKYILTIRSYFRLNHRHKQKACSHLELKRKYSNMNSCIFSNYTILSSNTSRIAKRSSFDYCNYSNSTCHSTFPVHPTRCTINNIHSPIYFTRFSHSGLSYWHRRTSYLVHKTACFINGSSYLPCRTSYWYGGNSPKVKRNSPKVNRNFLRTNRNSNSPWGNSDRDNRSSDSH